MIEILLATMIHGTSMAKSEQINQFCANIVGIPYASGDFNSEQWDKFVYCREHLK